MIDEKVKADVRQASPEAQAYTDWIMARHRMGEIIATMKDLMSEQEKLIEILAKGNPMDAAMSGIVIDDVNFDAVIAETPRWRMADIMADLGVTKKTVYRWINELGFPKPKIIKNVAYWHERDVKHWHRDNENKIGRWPAAT